MRRLTLPLGTLAAAGALAGLATCYHGPEQLDRRLNRVIADPAAPEPDASDRAFHETLFVADLHSDTLKWDRDLLEHSTFGHLDLPRMVEGNVALQAFTIVTKSPIPTRRDDQPGGFCVSSSSVNVAALLAAVQGRPAFSQRERALFQVRRLKDAIRRSAEWAGPELRLIETAKDLRALVADRKEGQQVIGAILGIEGGHWVGTPGSAHDQAVEHDMQELFEAGVRMFAPTHRFDNALSGASEGCERDGLTELGRRAVEQAQALGIAVDLAHISPAGLEDALDVLAAPPVVSHTGIQSGCEAPCRPHRNLSDDEIGHLLDAGGLIGIGYWPQAIGPALGRIGDVMAHIMQIAEDEGLQPGRHIALGSDFDGSVSPFIDVSQLDVLTTIMRRREQPFDETTIRNIAGRNACRYFARVLPGGGPEVAHEICDDARTGTKLAGVSGGSAQS